MRREPAGLCKKLIGLLILGLIGCAAPADRPSVAPVARSTPAIEMAHPTSTATLNPPSPTALAPTTQPTPIPTATPTPLPPNAADGLIFENNYAWRIIDGEGSRPILPCERPSLAIFASVYPALDLKMFSVEDGQLLIGDLCSSDTKPFIDLPNRQVRRIWGQVNDWLLVESGEEGLAEQGVWPLTAVRLDGTDYQVLTEPFFGNPILSPDGVVLIPIDGQVLRWDGERMADTKIDWFLTGSYSPDGQLLAVIQNDRLAIYDLDGAVVWAMSLRLIGADSPPLPPAWQPNGEWVAVEGVDVAGNFSTVRLLNVKTGEERVINRRHRPQFSPDGRWLAAYAYEDGHTTLIDMDSWEGYQFAQDGWPVGWVDLAGAAVGPLYIDEALDFSIELPASWAAAHANGTTTISNSDGTPQLRVRSYLNRGGYLSVKSIAESSSPPAVRDSVILAEAVIAGYPAVKTNLDITYIDVGGRYLAIEALSDDPIIPILLETLEAEPTDFSGNYIVISSENWIAELTGGGNVAESLTVHRRDGRAGYTLFSEEADDGLHYDLADPLFFSIDETYFYFHQRTVADGCSILFGGGDLTRVDLSSGTQLTLEGTSGVGHVLSPDRQKVAFFQDRLSNEFPLNLYDLSSGRTETIMVPLDGNYVAADSLIFSPDGTRVAFAAQQQFCGGDWTIGVITLETAAVTMFNADDLAYWRPVEWVDDVIVLRPYVDDDTRYLDLNTGDILLERP